MRIISLSMDKSSIVFDRVQNKNEKLETSDEKPEFLLISTAKNGNFIYSKLFNPSMAKDVNFIIAVNGSVNHIRQIDYNIILKPMGPFMVYYAFTGGSPDRTQKKLEWLIEVLQAMPQTSDALAFAMKTGEILQNGFVDEFVTEIIAPNWVEDSLSFTQNTFGGSQCCYADLKDRKFELAL